MSKKKICIASSTSWLVRGRSRRRICITNYANINGSDRNNWAPLYARNLLELDGQSAIIVLDNGGCVFHPNVTTVSIIVTADSKENPGIGHVGVEYAPPPFQARELKSAKNEIVGINKVSIPPPAFSGEGTQKREK